MPDTPTPTTPTAPTTPTTTTTSSYQGPPRAAAYSSPYSSPYSSYASSDASPYGSSYSSSYSSSYGTSYGSSYSSSQGSYSGRSVSARKRHRNARQSSHGGSSRGGSSSGTYPSGRNSRGATAASAPRPLPQRTPSYNLTAQDAAEVARISQSNNDNQQVSLGQNWRAQRLMRRAATRLFSGNHISGGQVGKHAASRLQFFLNHLRRRAKRQLEEAAGRRRHQASQPDLRRALLRAALVQGLTCGPQLCMATVRLLRLPLPTVRGELLGADVQPDDLDHMRVLLMNFPHPTDIITAIFLIEAPEAFKQLGEEEEQEDDDDDDLEALLWTTQVKMTSTRYGLGLVRSWSALDASRAAQSKLIRELLHLGEQAGDGKWLLMLDPDILRPMVATGALPGSQTPPAVLARADTSVKQRGGRCLLALECGFTEPTEQLLVTFAPPSGEKNQASQASSSSSSASSSSSTLAAVVPEQPQIQERLRALDRCSHGVLYPDLVHLFDEPDHHASLADPRVQQKATDMLQSFRALLPAKIPAFGTAKCDPVFGKTLTLNRAARETRSVLGLLEPLAANAGELSQADVCSDGLLLGLLYAAGLDQLFKFGGLPARWRRGLRLDLGLTTLPRPVDHLRVLSQVLTRRQHRGLLEALPQLGERLRARNALTEADLQPVLLRLGLLPPEDQEEMQLQLSDDEDRDTDLPLLLLSDHAQLTQFEQDLDRHLEDQTPMLVGRMGQNLPPGLVTGPLST